MKIFGLVPLIMVTTTTVLATLQGPETRLADLDKRTLGHVKKLFGFGGGSGCGCAHYKRKRDELEKRTFFVKKLIKKKIFGGSNCNCVPPNVIQTPPPPPTVIQTPPPPPTVIQSPPPPVVIEKPVPPPQVIYEQAPVPQVIYQQAPAPQVIYQDAPAPPPVLVELPAYQQPSGYDQQYGQQQPVPLPPAPQPAAQIGYA